MKLAPRERMALGILAASGQIPAESLMHREFAGELSLTGALRPMRGAFAMACGTARSHAAQAGAELPLRPAELYLPSASAAEAALVPDVHVYGATDLPSLCAHVAGVPDGPACQFRSMKRFSEGLEKRRERSS